MTSSPHNQWWLGAGEEFWRDDIADRKWRAVFEGDDGGAWAICVENLSEDVPDHHLLWDHQTRSLAGVASVDEAALPRDVRWHVQNQCQKRLSEAQLTEAHYTLIVGLADALANGDQWVLGRVLRAKLREQLQTFARTVDQLTPRYVCTLERPDGDYYSLTLPGLMAAEGSQKRLGSVVNAVLAVLRRKYDESKASVSSYLLTELRAAGLSHEVSDRWIWNVVVTAGLHQGGVSGGWVVPRDVERLKDLQTLNDFVAYIRGGTSPARAWPTAPLRIPGLDDPEPQPAFPAIERLKSTSDAADRTTATQTTEEPVPDSQMSRRVFVIHGRNDAARQAVFDLLRSLGLQPIEWAAAKKATGKPSPFVWQIVEAGFKMAVASLVILTGDDLAQLRPDLIAPHDGEDERTLCPQPRPNVLIEMGAALMRGRDQTTIVQVGGRLRGASDLGGFHRVLMSDTPAKRKEIADCLENASCAVDTSGTDWMSAGDFASALKAARYEQSDADAEDEELEAIEELSWTVLQLIAQSGIVTLPEVAEQLELSEPDVQLCYDLLEDDGLAKKVTMGGGVSATNDGKKELRRAGLL